MCYGTLGVRIRKIRALATLYRNLIKIYCYPFIWAFDEAERSTVLAKMAASEVFFRYFESTLNYKVLVPQSVKTIRC